MKADELLFIQKAQSEYLKLISTHKKLFKEKVISFSDLGVLLDEIKYFWLKKIEIIEFELETLVTKNSCFLLCGAVYLGINDQEHFYFKSLGDYHLLFDPLLKMDNIIRAPQEKINRADTSDYLKRVYTDTIKVLSNFKNQFYILPIEQLAIEDKNKHNKNIEDFFLKFLSQAFNKDFSNKDDFCHQYQTYEQIENDIDDYIYERLKFNFEQKDDKTLRNRIKDYSQSQFNFSAMTKGFNESTIFFVVVFQWIAQILDQLIISLSLGLIPYIRFGLTFHYLTLLMYTFIEDSYLREVIEKTIVFYIFSKTIPSEIFKNMDFNEYVNKIEGQQIITKIIDEMHKQNIDIFKGGTKEVRAIIEIEMKEYLITV